MKYSEIGIQAEGSQPTSKLCVYIQDTTAGFYIKKRPLVLICPGGGYNHVSEREGEPVALTFLAMGYHAAVLKYSCAPSQYPTQLLELAKAMCYLKDNAEEFKIDREKIFVCGFSAGGHLAASLGCFWDDEIFSKELNISEADREKKLKPFGMILGYPVITSGESAHRDSFRKLLGDRQEDSELLNKVSLENQVSDKMPQTFIWGTYTDASVPVENSLLFLSALRKAGVSAEYHLFRAGQHGLSLGTTLTQSAEDKHIQPEVNLWVDACRSWLKSVCE